MRDSLLHFGLMLLRGGFASMLFFGHGLEKAQKLIQVLQTDEGLAGVEFLDPFGVGAGYTFAIAVLCEAVAPAFVAFGLLTRLAAFGVVTTMVGAIYHHWTGGDPFFAKGGASMEPAWLYLIPFLTLVFTGPGRLALDALFMRDRDDDELLL